MRNESRATTKLKVLCLIQKRTIDNPIRSKQIELDEGIRGSEVRDVIRELRRDGYLIGSISKKVDNEGGYYYIRSHAQLEQTLQHLRNRVESLQHTINSMEHRSIDEFDKQQDFFKEGGDTE